MNDTNKDSKIRELSSEIKEFFDEIKTETYNILEDYEDALENKRISKINHSLKNN